MPLIPPADLLHRRLAETIAWCRVKASSNDPKNSLRTPALRPANLSLTPDKWGSFDYNWESVESAISSVEALAERRAELLRQADMDDGILSFDLAGGRLLIADPEDSDQCALSEPESLGFIDDLDVPAWDTWVCYVHEQTTPDPDEVRKTQSVYQAQWNKGNSADFEDWTPRESVSYILCWIPSEFISLVQEGIAVNPVECFFWAAEYRQRHYNTPLMRRLDAEGLLR